MLAKINFDANGQPEEPTLILAKKNGDKLGKINAHSIALSGNLNDANEITFTVYKYIDNELDPLWDKIADFKLVYYVETDSYFEIKVEIDESNETKKTVFATSLGEAELSQIMLYNIEINTEIDIERDEYVLSTVLYNDEHPEASLLHRLLEKAPHYSIGHVDDSIKNIQRTFSFDDKSIYDAFQEISEEINCLFVFPSNSDEDGNIQRTIEVYDLESNCLNPDCNHRGEFTNVCPKCGETNISYYGKDTGIFITSDELANDIQLSSNTDEVKNCFKLEAGDDLMTATIRNCNPNGSDYIWYLSDAMKADMSDELVQKIDEYNKAYNHYQSCDIELDENYDVESEESLVTKYNQLVEHYNEFMNLDDDDKFEKINDPLKGFSSLIDAYYNTFDMYLYLESGLMPTINTAIPSIDDEINELTSENLSPVAVNISTTSTADPLKALSISTADSLVLSVAKTFIDSRYKIKIADNSTLSDYVENAGKRTWKGKFILTAYSDEEATATTEEDIEVEINADYETFVKRKLEKALSAEDVEDMSISGLFKKELAINLMTSDGKIFKDSNGDFFMIGSGFEESFEAALKQYSLNRLISFRDACQACVDIMVEQGIADGETWGNVDNADLYANLYTPYLNKLRAIELEISVRDAEIALIIGEYDNDGNLKSDGLQTIIEKKKSEIQDALDFEKFLGEKLWLEFCSFRREDKYSNDNYISEGLNNADVISKANEFIQVAQKEIVKSAESQRSISSTLKNLLVIPKFAALVKDFQVGNYLWIMIDDEVYKLRLINYEIEYDDIDKISVEFSDAVNSKNSISDIKDIMSQASSMATSYSSVKRQAKQGEESKTAINNWVDNGLDATNVKIMGGADGQAQTWDRHGMLFREYDDVTGEYSPEQMKIINSTMAITTDNWQTTKTAVGKYFYVHPDTGEIKMAYGVNAETIIGKLILGENLELRNSNNTLIFDDNGLVVKDDTNIVAIDPDAESIFNIKHLNKDIYEDILYFDEDGNLTIKGNITALNNLNILTTDSTGSTITSNLHPVAISGEYKDLTGIPELATVATSGDYNDLENKPTLSSVAMSGNYEDLENKPALSNVALTGNYADLVGDVSDVGKFLSVDESGNVVAANIGDVDISVDIAEIDNEYIDNLFTDLQ